MKEFGFGLADREVTLLFNKRDKFCRFVFRSSNQGLDFEMSSKHTLLVAVENEVPFAVQLPTATATVVVTVQDVNEAPVFQPKEKLVSKREDLAVDSDVTQYIAFDPDSARSQKVM